jgi:hypothetical protein
MASENERRPRLNWIARHRTRLLGYLIVFIGAIQASGPHLATVMSPLAYNWTMIVMGIVVTIVGHHNARDMRR